jgi:hypothetical protein
LHNLDHRSDLNTPPPPNERRSSSDSVNTSESFICINAGSNIISNTLNSKYK